MSIATLVQAVSSVCPILGFSGNEHDKSTWVWLYPEGTTKEQRDKLKQLVDDYQPDQITATNATQVSDTQFIQALAEDKYAIITWQQAADWGASGTLPQILITALDKIQDTTTRNRAYMKARSAKTYIYSDRWVQSILQLLPQDVVAKMPGTDAQDKLQQLFNFAATL